MEKSAYNMAFIHSCLVFQLQLGKYFHRRVSGVIPSIITDNFRSLSSGKSVLTLFYVSCEQPY